MPPYSSGQWRKALTLKVSIEVTLYIGGQCGSVPLTLVVSRERPLTLEVNGRVSLSLRVSREESPYIGNGWWFIPLYWWSMVKWPFTMEVSDEVFLTDWSSVVKCLLLVVCSNVSTYIGSQWRRAPLHCWSVVKGPHTLVVNDEGASYIDGQGEEKHHYRQDKITLCQWLLICEMRGEVPLVPHWLCQVTLAPKCIIQGPG